ncbi:MAG: Trm112 family protein [Candidatus Acidiferrales bacterium]
MAGEMNWKDLLVCPVCRTKVRPVANGLRCETCRRVYPIRDGFPVMLPEEASVEQDAGKS